MAGSRMDQIFLKGLEDVIKITYFDDYMEDDTEDDDDDNMEDDTEDDDDDDKDDDENKYKDIKTKEDNDIKDDNAVKIGRPLRMRRVSSRSWSAGDFGVLSTASMMSYK